MPPFACPVCGAFVRRAASGVCSKCGTEWDNGTETMVRELVAHAAAPSVPDACPDDGACWHACTDMCFRVRYCGPLSGVFPGDEWPADVDARPRTQARTW